ncbi:MAG TPA: glycosyl hydrolase [Chloroflexi bacterium]|nr:glycosyl hydrolase [Chloroflexota bacterium]
MEQKIEQLLAQLTLEEKVAMIAGADLWHTLGVERLGIPQIRVTDGPNGARGAEGEMAPPSVCTPVGVALAATWNPELIQRVGEVLGDETKTKGSHVLLAPTVNIHRGPLAGRNFECYSEDPYLTARMAVAYINGLQSKGVSACIKHFVCNDSEFERTSMSSEVSERALREIYLYPFMVAVAEAKPWTLMSAYNKINGVWASENSYTLRQILKGEWGFDGLVMSDWTGTYTDGPAAGGLDLEMPGPGRWMGENVLKMVQSAQLSEDLIDDKIRRLLRTVARVGAFENPVLQPESSVDDPAHRAVVRQAASEAIVLLKNENNLLPLAPDQYKTIAIIGQNALEPPIMGGGSSRVTPHPVVSPLEAIFERVAEGTEIKYALGASLYRNLPPLNMEFVSFNGQTGMQVEVFDNFDLSGAPAATHLVDRSGLSWSDGFVAPANPHKFSARISATFSAPESGSYTFALTGNGLNRLSFAGRTVIDNWGEAREDPWEQAKQGVQVELNEGQAYAFQIEFAYEGSFPWRGLQINCLPPMPEDPLGEALAAASQADLVILFAGNTAEWESESFDRPDMELPQNQNELINEVLKVNPHTVIVLNTGAPVHMPWIEHVPAMIQAWFGGQEMGNAIADVLFGLVNPSGKLPTTFPVRLQDNPAYLNYPGENGHVHYGEGLFVGYRYYEYKDVPPLFPFGFGLSYTSFEYGEVSLSAAEFGPGETLTASLTLKNTGERAGQEVVQLYLRDVQSRLVRPLKELKSFAKVALQPGEWEQISFEIGEAALAYYDDAARQWLAEPGTFEIFIGGSSQGLEVSARFEWRGSPQGNRV